MLAFWVGSTVTDAQRACDGRRQAAGVAHHVSHHGGGRRQASRFGCGRERDPRQQAGARCSRRSRASSPSATRAIFGSVVTNQLSERGQRGRDDQEPRSGVLRIDGVAQRSVAGRRGGSAEVRFTPRRARVGRARMQMTRAAERRNRRVRGRGPGGDPRLAGDGGGLRPDQPDGERDARRAPLGSCPASAGCRSRCRRRRSSASAKVRAISSSIRTAAPSSGPRARSR